MIGKLKNCQTANRKIMGQKDDEINAEQDVIDRLRTCPKEHPMTIKIRLATIDDWPTIVDFNCLLAVESEGKQLDQQHVEPGVKAVLADPHKGRYLLRLADERLSAN